jgi:anaerobic selenocysteine-containing dehydrogenase
MAMTQWKQSACILCENNCGIEVQLDETEQHIVRIRGDQEHPASQGYLCQKASRLDYYQNGKDRITSPLRKRDDGSFEVIDWDTAIREVAARFAELRDSYGGGSIFYYGGGGQGNHLPGAYSSATRKALNSTFRSNALAQEKTGEFWVNNQMLGASVRGDFEHCDVAVFIGKNPWQSHGIPRARVMLKAIHKDPQRKMIVIDPVRTETADLADYHLQVKPGTDAWLLNAMLAILFDENLVDHEFIDRHCDHLDSITPIINNVDIAGHCAIAGVDEKQVREAVRCIAGAPSAAFFEDLGVQMNRHSTLVSYLEKLLWLLTGNFGKRGAQYVPTYLQNLTGSGRASRKSPVVGANIISGLVPCNVIAEEILSDHPARYRGMLVEAANPAHSLAESPRFADALRSLDTLVVIDIAMSETAALADYVLPATTQYEKWEATFFNFEFPDNYFHLRKPLFAAPEGPLPEAEIHTRLVQQLGALPDELIEKLRAILPNGRIALRDALMGAMMADPDLVPLAPVVLYQVLGPQLNEGADAAAALWPLTHMFAMREPQALANAGFSGDNAAEELFDAILNNHSGVVFARDSFDASWQRIQTANGRLQLASPPLLSLWQEMLTSDASLNADYPFVLCAGERRSYTANTIFRDPEWRRKDSQGALRISPADAAHLGLNDGDQARLSTQAGSVVTTIEISDRMQAGHIALPNGSGLENGLIDGHSEQIGVAPNALTLAANRDAFAGTPLHKFVAAKLD